MVSKASCLLDAGYRALSETAAPSPLPTAVPQALEFTQGWLRLTFARPHAVVLLLLVGVPAAIGAASPRASLRWPVLIAGVFAAALIIFACMLPAFYAQLGIDTFASAGFAANIALYHELEEKGELTARFYEAPMIEGWQNQARLGIGHGFGSQFLRLGANKAFADGSLADQAVRGDPPPCLPRLAADRRSARISDPRLNESISGRTSCLRACPF